MVVAGRGEKFLIIISMFIPIIVKILITRRRNIGLIPSMNNYTDRLDDAIIVLL